MEAPVQNEVVFYRDGNVTVSRAKFIKLPIIIVVHGFLLLFSDCAGVAGLIFTALGIIILFAIKNEFAVRISTNSGESNSIISKDKTYIQKIVNALNEAIIHRG
ncbi:DUF6232 family protein [Mucilaginibacter sp. L3T2-6]|uniref:DUF6232 family protein n=1 Tax=Mucilaginibacter sp. L3T2-6 TaxID=3062491 RepID=UPI0026757F83|nr:DUF6232 family protein [Mucilaginibacter sp. L3T2-6]MDO3641277.1 DUF6232 family protein [Mucilaginibacter sp. L3T2-6]MDV6213963.1 DUF6232 family protein [Mucilaginibacter sp. L3T2-6]